jgi:hypothetical protein
MMAVDRADYCVDAGPEAYLDMPQPSEWDVESISAWAAGPFGFA